MIWLRWAATSPAFLLSVSLVACKQDDPPHGNGVNDVRGACLLRASWTAPLAEKCAQCRSVASLEDCGCEALKDFGAKCVVQGRAKRAEPTCTPAIDDCVLACGSDCGCADACYASAPACKGVAAAQDGCVADVCASYCNADGGIAGGG